MIELWNNLFVEPFLNVIVLFYETVAFGNLGVAVIMMTILLRLALFPLTIISERNKAKYERLEEDMEHMKDIYVDDPVKLKEHIRSLLQRHRISPWAKATVLLAQGLVLLGIYTVFNRGITTSLDGLYAWVPQPQLPINTIFLGADVSIKSFYWSLTVGIVLYLTIVVDQRKHEQILGREDAVFRYAFPLTIAMVLSLLPMVKALFILTSILFSVCVSFIRHRIWPTE